MSQDKSDLSEKKVDLPTESKAQDNDELRTMFMQFIFARNEDRKTTSNELAGLRAAIESLAKGSPNVSVDSPIPDRSSTNRRTSMFFGSPDAKGYESSGKNTIQVLHADIVYEHQLKVSSLEGLQYLAKQLALYTSTYPGREIKLAHMVAYALRPHVVAAWNSYCYKESLITGVEPKDIMVEDWLSLSNTQVQEILVEAARPRTRELYSRELVLFLGKGIPQTPAVNTENFSQMFYAPLMKSLNDLLHLHDLLSEETSNHSTNKAKMPVPGYGTRDNPGQIQLWIYSLGSQKEAVLQWLGKDELMKHKTVEHAVKYIRTKLMEGRLNSETRQDFDSKLSPVRYEDLRHTQGESYTRQQSSFNSKPQNKFPSRMPFNKDSRASTSLSAVTDSPRFVPDNDNDITEHCHEEYSDNEEAYDDTNHDDTVLLAAQQTTVPNAVASTYRGYCGDLFVFGNCPRRETSCILDHSAAGQERCIQSFHLLAKRELGQHGQLPPYTIPPRPDRQLPSLRPTFPTKYQDSRIPRIPGYPTRPSNFK
jgi:hypothetical protein